VELGIASVMMAVMKVGPPIIVAANVMVIMRTNFYNIVVKVLDRPPSAAIPMSFQNELVVLGSEGLAVDAQFHMLPFRVVAPTTLVRRATDSRDGSLLIAAIAALAIGLSALRITPLRRVATLAIGLSTLRKTALRITTLRRVATLTIGLSALRRVAALAIGLSTLRKTALRITTLRRVATLRRIAALTIGLSTLRKTALRITTLRRIAALRVA
jgi:hypothetical protein